MQAADLRLKYIEFFTSRGHLHLPGAPLEPIDALGTPDTSTLFTSAGMQQFKPYFIGTATPPSGRITTVQKCVRTRDIDDVGDFSHCTFFEMLGNFSFGDYFKAEVIPWTWEFLTRAAGLDPERFCVTVYHEDEEAYAIWRDVVGLPEDRIHRLGEDKNYWPAKAISEGPNGPCGPCSEVFYRVAPLESMTTDPSLTSTERYLIDDAAGRWLEVWNNVFTQFDRDEDTDGKAILRSLPKKNNDTGAGFDRIVCLTQGKTSVFDTDLFQPTLTRIAALSGREYGGGMEPADFAFRVVAEHSRCSVFCIADGILPSNEGRGYVLRYIIRRAVRYGKSALGFDKPFLHKVAPEIIKQMGDFYPELREKREFILAALRDEEERFRRTLDNGMGRLTEMFEAATARGETELPGQDVFTLYDTFGFPLRLTEELAQERGLKVDLAGFERAMDTQRRRSQESSNIDRSVMGGAEDGLSAILKRAGATDFTGYTQSVADATVVGILAGGVDVETAGPGEEVQVALDRSPFYAESGGQVGDTGTLTAPAGDTTCALRFAITDTRKTGGVWVHAGKVEEGFVAVGERVTASVDVARRRAIQRNHTATHLVQAALRLLIGGHVHQKGSLVAPDRLRFDFTHSQPLTPEQIRALEQHVNRSILEDTGVTVHSDVPIAKAKARGAMALFGEKYGDHVRMIEIPEVSLELCGGIHLERTSQVGLFKITSESGVAAGVRRIEAVTGDAAYQLTLNREATLGQVASLLKTNPTDLVVAAEKLMAQRQELEKQVRLLKSGGAPAAAEITAESVHGVQVAARVVEGADAETIANMADAAEKHLGSAVIVLGTVSDGKVALVARVSPDLIARGLNAGAIVRAVAKITGGGGGGRADFAQAGGRDPAKLADALAAVPGLVADAIQPA